MNSLARSQSSVWESWDSTQAGTSPHPAQGLPVLCPQPLKQRLTQDAIDYTKEGGVRRSVLMLGGVGVGERVGEDFAEEELPEQF